MKMRVTKSMAQLTSITVLLLCTTALATASPRQFTADLVAGPEIGVNQFQDLIASVVNGDLGAKSRFAEVAIEIMVDAYMNEIEHPNAIIGAQPSFDPSWRSGTLRYIERLQAIANSIRPGSVVHVINEPPSAIRLVIDGQQVMLSAPRLEDQVVFERSIAETVCRFSDCRKRAATIEDRVAERTSRLDGAWEFGRKTPPTYASSDGLQCVFDDRRHLKLKKDACLDLVHELRLLVEAFAALDAHHKPIDWRAIRIDQVAAGREQKLTYNANGNFVRMFLPRLSRAESVWRGAIPWVKANLRGRTSQHVITLPDQIVYLTSMYES